MRATASRHMLSATKDRGVVDVMTVRMYVVSYDEPQQPRSGSFAVDGSVEESLKKRCRASVQPTSTKTTIVVHTNSGPGDVAEAVRLGLDADIGTATVTLVHDNTQTTWAASVMVVEKAGNELTVRPFAR